MNSNHYTTSNRDVMLENFGAALTEAAYPVMLRHGAADNWLDLELDLWKALKEAVKKWGPEWSSAGAMRASSLQSRNPHDESV